MKKVLMFSGLLFASSNQITVTSTKNWRRKIVEAAAVRKRQVLDRSDLLDFNFVYHMNYVCYKSYTLRKTLESVQKSNESDN